LECEVNVVAKEIERKAYVENLYKRTPEQIAEENALMAEVKRIEAYDKKARAEREEFINILESPRTMGDTRGYEGSQGMNILFQTLVAADKTRVKQQQRKQSMSQVNVPPGQTSTQDSAMNAREEVARRFRRFSLKEGVPLCLLEVTIRISLWYRVSRENYTRSSTQICKTHYFETYYCAENVQCIQRDWTFREACDANCSRL
jgi:hypothetical protein